MFTHLIENKKDAIQIGEAYCRRGEAYLHQGAADLAIRDFAEALDRDPKMPEAYHGRGNACRHQGNVDRAMADLEEAMRLKPELVAPLVDRGNMHRESGSLDRAIEDFATAIARMRVRGSWIGDGDGHFYRAVARCARQDWGRQRVTLRRQGKKVCWSLRRSAPSLVACLISKPVTTWPYLLYLGMRTSRTSPGATAARQSAGCLQ